MDSAGEQLADESADTKKIASDAPCLDYVLGSTATIAIAGVAEGQSTSKPTGDFDAVDRPSPASSHLDDESGPFGRSKTSSSTVSSLNTVASMLNRRTHAGGSPVANGDQGGPALATLNDVKKFVFQTNTRADKRIMGGLRALTFTSQAFISSFAVGLAIGSLLAVIIKILTEVGFRVLLR